MIGLLQRVSRAEVRVAGDVVGAIGPGLMVLVGVQRDDSEATARRLAERLVGYRVFEDVTERERVSWEHALLAPRSDYLVIRSWAYVRERER